MTQNTTTTARPPLERRVLPHPPRAERRSGDDKGEVIEGYAAVYYNGTPETEYELAPDLVERIMPGAAAAAVEMGDDARCSFNHDPQKLLGRRSAGTLELWNDEKGLGYRVKPPETSYARDLLDLLRRGDVRESSLLFCVSGPASYCRRGRVSWSFEQRDGRVIEVREIHDLTVLEVGPVAVAAYSGTSAATAARARATGDIGALLAERDRRRDERTALEALDLEVATALRRR